MKSLVYILSLVILISCNQNHSKQNELNLTSKNIESINPKTEESTDSKQAETNIIKFREIKPDYFEIDQKDFEKYEDDNSKWFINSSGTDKLYFVPYTDYSITTAILTNEKLKEKELEFLKVEGIKVDDLEKSIKIENIKSKKGITLGLTINQVKEILGQPDEKKNEYNREFLKWNFIMKEDNSEEQIGGLKPFILKGIEFTAEMEFLDHKLTRLIYRYDVP